MIPFSSSLLDILFLLSVAVIWMMIVYQLILTLMGFFYRRLSLKEEEQLRKHVIDLPGISVLIPMRNEELVIEGTLSSVLSLDYPSEKLEVIVINDGSTDRTEDIVRRIADRDSRVKVLSLPVTQVGRGKSRALNEGLKMASHGFIAVYDADNNPEPLCLKHLIRQLLADSKLAAVIGKFRTKNKYRNWLTRFVSIETLAFQWIVQAGRYKTFKIAILPGTNFIIRRSVLEECGGWDEKAITEDSELSVRIYQKGYRIKFVPYATTWEQEPERLRVWVRQRTRWVRGNFYVMRKFLRQSLGFKNKIVAMELQYLFLLYYLFLVAIVLSHVFFLLSAVGIIALQVPGPYFAVWAMALALFFLEVSLSISYERDARLSDLVYIALMYFTYCQAWIYVVFRALILDYVKKEGSVWDKTERFGEVPVLKQRERG